MSQYQGLRKECQETFYNIGRMFHQMNLLSMAEHFYEKCLNVSSKRMKQRAILRTKLYFETCGEKTELHTNRWQISEGEWELSKPDFAKTQIFTQYLFGGIRCIEQGCVVSKYTRSIEADAWYHMNRDPNF